MTVIEFHPDQLVEREMRGELSEEERVLLDEHLHRCASCRIERQIRRDFDTELAEPEDAAKLDSFVLGALKTAGTPIVQEPRPQRFAEGAPRKVAAAPRHRRMLVVLAATLALASGIAFAETGVVGRARDLAVVVQDTVVSLFQPAPTKAPLPQSASKRSSLARPQPSNQAPAEVDEFDALGSLEDAPGPATTPQVPASVAPLAVEAGAPPPALLARPPTHSLGLDARRLPPSIEQAPASLNTTGEAAHAPSTATSLFEQANAARRRGATRDALAFYRSLADQYPGSAEARVSLAIVGRMHLDAGRHEAALASFSAYLASADRGLSQQAMEGRALALKGLGRQDEEKRAWRDLLRYYPGSGYEALARKRLGEAVP